MADEGNAGECAVAAGGSDDHRCDIQGAILSKCHEFPSGKCVIPAIKVSGMITKLIAPTEKSVGAIRSSGKLERLFLSNQVRD